MLYDIKKSEDGTRFVGRYKRTNVRSIVQSYDKAGHEFVGRYTVDNNNYTAVREEVDFTIYNEAQFREEDDRLTKEYLKHKKATFLRHQFALRFAHLRDNPTAWEIAFWFYCGKFYPDIDLSKD